MMAGCVEAAFLLHYGVFLMFEWVLGLFLYIFVEFKARSFELCLCSKKFLASSFPMQCMWENQ